MLLHRLSKGQRVFFQVYSDQVNYFDQHGVHSLLYFGPDSWLLCMAMEDSWVLIDVDDHVWQPKPGGWLSESSAPLIIMASSPHPSRQGRFTKQFNGEIWVMNSWCQEELVIEGCVFFLFGVRVHCLTNHLQRLARRVCRDYFQHLPIRWPSATRYFRLSIPKHWNCSRSNAHGVGTGYMYSDLNTTDNGPPDRRGECVSQGVPHQPTHQDNDTINRAECTVSFLCTKISDMLVEKLDEQRDRLENIWMKFFAQTSALVPLRVTCKRA